MKMKKLLRMATFSIVVLLLVFNVYSASDNYITREAFQEQHRNQLIKLCEAIYAEKDISDLYFCILAEFYALGHVMDIMDILYKDPESKKVFSELSKKYYIKEFETYDFMAIELEFKAYLQEKEIKNNEGNNLPDRSNLGR